MQSGGGHRNGFNRNRTQDMAQSEGEELMKELGVKTIAEMRAMSAEELIQKSMAIAFAAMKKGTGGLMFTPVIDNNVMIDSYEDTVEKGLALDIDYMLGSTKNDMTVTPEMLARGEKSPLYHGCIAWSEAQQKLGRKPSYVYYFSRELPGDEAGAFHSSELWYVFSTLDRCWRPLTEDDHKLSNRVVGYWTNFMKTGDPNGEGLAKWEPCLTEKSSVIELDI